LHHSMGAWAGAQGCWALGPPLMANINCTQLKFIIV